MKKILIFSRYFLPGYKAGGPIRSISNFYNNLKDEYSIKIICLPRDYLSKDNYKNIKINNWNYYSSNNFIYCSSTLKQIFFLFKYIKKYNPDIIYLNSFFDFQFSIFPFFLNKFFFKKKILICTRGEFNSDALKFKKIKKYLFIGFIKFINIYNQVNWQLTDKTESIRLKKIFNDGKFYSTSNFFHKITHNISPQYKEKDKIKIIYFGRIHPIKNIDLTIKSLVNIKGKLIFDIYGAVDDFEYYKSCINLSKALPNNIKVNFLKPFDYQNLTKIISRYHLFISMSKSENFGHSIIEAIGCGLPIIISKFTPWRNLAKENVGFDIESSELILYKTICKYLKMDNEEYRLSNKGVSSFYNKISNHINLKQKYIHMLNKVLSS